jgi:hypothetical protein
MWDRIELKARAKESFKRNYWKCVLVGLIFMLVAGGTRSSVFSGLQEDSDAVINGDVSGDDYSNLEDGMFPWGDIEITAGTSEGPEALVFFGLGAMIVLVLGVIFIVADIFLFNPLEMGCDRFFLRNLNEQAQVGNVGFAFDTNYLNIVGTMFFRDLYTFLWSLLFVIPGIIKRYEYMMVPYLLAEDPQMPRQEAFAVSKRMMDGQKWDAFVLELSFIGWMILSALTLGILNIFWVQPYLNSSRAAIYEAIRYGTPQPQPQDLGDIYG